MSLSRCVRGGGDGQHGLAGGRTGPRCAACAATLRSGTSVARLPAAWRIVGTRTSPFERARRAWTLASLPLRSSNTRPPPPSRQLLASNVLNPHHIDVSLDDVGGLDEVKRDMVGVFRGGRRRAGRLTRQLGSTLPQRPS